MDQWTFSFAATAYNLVRMRKLIPMATVPEQATVALRVAQTAHRATMITTSSRTRRDESAENRESSLHRGFSAAC